MDRDRLWVLVDDILLLVVFIGIPFAPFIALGYALLSRLFS